MKITKTRLKQIIQEEVAKELTYKDKTKQKEQVFTLPGLLPGSKELDLKNTLSDMIDAIIRKANPKGSGVDYRGTRNPMAFVFVYRDEQGYKALDSFLNKVDSVLKRFFSNKDDVYNQLLKPLQSNMRSRPQAEFQQARERLEQFAGQLSNYDRGLEPVDFVPAE